MIKALRQLSITPLLMPIDHHDSPFVPDAEVCEVLIPSDPSTLLDEDLRKAESSILQDDVQDNSSYQLDFGDLETLPLSGAPFISPPSLDQPKLDTLRAEGPLTPELSSPTVFSSNIDTEDLSKNLKIHQSSNILDARGEKDPDGILSDDVMSALEEQSERSIKTIEQEYLQASDAEARIPIPVLDFTVPEQEWEKISLDPSSQWNWIRETSCVSNISPWPGASKSENKLSWVPVSEGFTHISLQETIEDNGVSRPFIDFVLSSELPTSADFVWKQPGLAILQDQEDDWEELEPIVEQETKGDIDSLVRKRRAEMDAARSNSPSPVDLIRLPGNLMERPEKPSLQKPNKPASLLVRDDDASAAATLLSNYIDIRTAKRQKHSKSSFFPVTNNAQSETEISMVKTPHPVSYQAKHSTPPAEASLTDTTPAPCPPLNLPSSPVTIIKSLSLSRSIFSRLTRLYPSITIIERDFNRWDSVAWERNSVSRSPVVSPLAAEADIIVSPATGIVLTTLLKAIQKPLPGHKGNAAIREHLSSVALRYEHLIVLVSEGNRIDETVRSLSPSEYEGYADFSGFVAGLNTGGQTYYIGGGDDTLAKWLVSFIIQHSCEAADIQSMLLSEESLWELYLRRAGLNAYAAQAIPALLKAPDEESGEELGQFGLSQFIRMPATERLRMFKGILGGENVLTRVSNVVDTRWGSYLPLHDGHA